MRVMVWNVQTGTDSNVGKGKVLYVGLQFGLNPQVFTLEEDDDKVETTKARIFNSGQYIDPDTEYCGTVMHPSGATHHVFRGDDFREEVD